MGDPVAPRWRHVELGERVSLDLVFVEELIVDLLDQVRLLVDLSLVPGPANAHLVYLSHFAATLLKLCLRWRGRLHCDHWLLFLLDALLPNEAEQGFE